MSHAPCVNVSHAHPRTLLSAPHLLRLMAYITQEYAVAHCNTFSALQHTATHRNSLQRTALYIPHKHTHTHTHTHTPSGIRRTHTHTHTSTPTHPLTRPHIHTSSLSRARRTHLHIRHFISSSRPPQQKKKNSHSSTLSHEQETPAYSVCHTYVNVSHAHPRTVLLLEPNSNRRHDSFICIFCMPYTCELTHTHTYAPTHSLARTGHTHSDCVPFAPAGFPQLYTDTHALTLWRPQDTLTRTACHLCQHAPPHVYTHTHSPTLSCAQDTSAYTACHLRQQAPLPSVTHAHAYTLTHALAHAGHTRIYCMPFAPAGSPHFRSPSREKSQPHEAEEGHGVEGGGGGGAGESPPPARLV